jgi:hypothetical protein
MSSTPCNTVAISASSGFPASGCSLSATAALRRTTASIAGSADVALAACRPCSSTRCALNTTSSPARLRSCTIGASSTTEARSMPAGNPRTLACASFQSTDDDGGRPGSEISSGPVNSAIRSFGS